MTLNLTIPQQNHSDFTPRITVFGVGGGGTNAVDNMINMQLQGVEFVVANTDAQQLSHSKADRRIQLGPHLTQGLGAGAKPEIGRAAAEEACDELSRHLDGAHMIFITAGMGGGTGTGAAPVIARMARERGILTVGVVTKPFTFEGGRRAKSADAGIAELQQFVDTLIVIPNQNLFRLANERTSWQDAFKMADNVLYMGVRGVTDLMMAPGLVNLDFADIRTVMAEMGKAMMGTGEAEGENRAIAAAEDAISNPLLEDTSMSGAQGLLINITGGEDLTLFEVDQAAIRIREEVAEDANIIFGSAIDTSLNGRIRVSVVATGIDNPPSRAAAQPPQQPAETPAPAAAAPAAPQPAAPAAAAPAAPSPCRRPPKPHRQPSLPQQHRDSPLPPHRRQHTRRPRRLPPPMPCRRRWRSVVRRVRPCSPKARRPRHPNRSSPRRAACSESLPARCVATPPRRSRKPHRAPNPPCSSKHPSSPSRNSSRPRATLRLMMAGWTFRHSCAGAHPDHYIRGLSPAGRP